MVDVNSISQMLVGSGLLETFVPFILIFAIIYSALLLSEIFGSKIPKRIQTILSLSIAAIVIAPHITAPGSQYDIVPILLQVLPNIGLIFIGVVAILMLLGMVGATSIYQGTGGIFTIAIVLMVTYLFAVSSGFLPAIDYFDSDLVSGLLGLLIFFLIVGYITKEEKPDKSDEPSWYEKIVVMPGGIAQNKKKEK